jgi:outer membrane protein assembly factor BamB
MTKQIFRNIAIVSAVFIGTFSIMLITNYFQLKSTNPLNQEVIETLKQLNDANANNPELQKQIRELDLLARKAYFVRTGQLEMGLYILIGMLITFVVSLRLYYANEKNIPQKQLDPFDEWLVKTKARRYIVWGVGTLTVVTLFFVFLSSPLMTNDEVEQSLDASTQVAETEITPSETENIPDESNIPATDTTSMALAVDTVVPKVAEEVISKITHNAFRGNNSNGISSAKNVPTDWDLASGKNIAWKTTVPKKGYNSPVINGNKVFLTGADNDSRDLYCYELNTGKLLWTVAAANIPGSPAQMPKTTNDTGLAASTVATNGKQVCAIFATGDVICTDIDGKKLWAKNLGVPVNHYGYASSLLIHGSMLIIQYDNSNNPKVIALDVSTGNERWSKNRTDKIAWSSPIIANVNGQPQLILMGNPGITAYNPSNGEQLWRVECMSGEVGASPCSANGIVFGASEYATIIAINATDGSTLWTKNDYLPEVASPVATKDNVFVATSYGVLACYNAQNGDLRLQHELNVEFYSSPIIAEGKLFLFSNSGKMHVFSANNDFKLLKSFETGENTFATPAFTDGKIVVRTENSIYCVAAN